MAGVDVSSLQDAFIAGAVLTAINTLVKPILVVLTLPLTIITLGLFYFVVAAFCLWLASEIVPGFILQGKLRAVFAAILISLTSTLISRILTRATADDRPIRR